MHKCLPVISSADMSELLCSVCVHVYAADVHIALKVVCPVTTKRNDEKSLLKHLR